MADQIPYKEHASKLMLLGGPLILSHLAQMAVTVTDTVMLGWYDVEALAAVTLMGTMSFVFFIVGSGFAFAVMPLVAAASEAGDDVQIRRTTRMGMWLSILYFACVLPILLWSKTFLLMLGQEEVIATIAQTYARIAAWGMLAQLLVMVLKSYLSAMEITRVVLWATIASAVLNAIVNYALIFGNWGAPELGVQGAAIASVGANAIALIYLTVYALRRLPQHALFQRLWRPDWEAMATVYKLGWPIGLTNLAEVGLFAATTVMMGWIGTVALAAHGIALQIASITFMIHLGLSTAATVRAGRAAGRGNEVELRRGGIVAVGLSAIAALLTVALFLAVPEWLISLFLDANDPQYPEIISVGVSLLIVAALFQVADGAQVMALGLLRGVQDTQGPMFIAGLSYWAVGMTSSYVLGFILDFGAVGIWMGLVIGLGLAGVLMHLRFWRRSAKIGVAA
ncbi:MATE family efflux transporter [Aliiroseovarius sp. YM-037]|uniref:MATE family efflux transporter n=1 Tax=Aliiroseovarius sp. YM-037 TaxID=3341728 RepID=UPI003A8051BB